jgi:hypothetical protein
MKRCPECEFIYDDEQDRCDMDGTRLRFTTKLSTAFAEAAQTKSMRGTFTISLLATIILGVVLFIFYPPKWHTSTSLPAAQVRPAGLLNVNKESQLPLPEAPQNGVSTPSPKSAARSSRDPFAPMETTTEKSDNSVPATKPKMTTPAVANRSIEATPAMNQVTTASQPSAMSQKPPTPSYSTSGPSVRPVAAATATPKPVTQNSNKDSKFNSMMKKAGRILKKPF